MPGFLLCALAEELRFHLYCWPSKLYHHLAQLSTDTTWSKIRRLAMKEADVAVAVRRVRDAVYWRLTHGRPGRLRELYDYVAPAPRPRIGLPSEHSASSPLDPRLRRPRKFIRPREPLEL